MLRCCCSNTAFLSSSTQFGQTVLDRSLWLGTSVETWILEKDQEKTKRKEEKGSWTRHAHSSYIHFVLFWKSWFLAGTDWIRSKVKSRTHPQQKGFTFRFSCHWWPQVEPPGFSSFHHRWSWLLDSLQLFASKQDNSLEPSTEER